jgi:hypothetical protein
MTFSGASAQQGCAHGCYRMFQARDGVFARKAQGAPLEKLTLS